MAISFHPQYPRAPPFRRSLLLVTFLKRNSASVVPTHIVEIFDLVDPNDPIFTCVSFFERAELRAFRRYLRSSNSVLRLSGWEEGVEVVVGHFVPGSHSC